jgi:hypothetical protein
MSSKHSKKDVRRALDQAQSFINRGAGGAHDQALEAMKVIALGYLKYGSPQDGGLLTTGEILYDHFGMDAGDVMFEVFR